jgi:hypothetical protein
MSIKTMEKPLCKLPEILQSSYLIGLVITRLKEEDMIRQIHDFVGEVRARNSNFTYEDIVLIAEKYVEFYRD